MARRKRNGIYTTFAKWPYNRACIKCDDRWLDDLELGNVEVTICKSCLREHDLEKARAAKQNSMTNPIENILFGNLVMKGFE